MSPSILQLLQSAKATSQFISRRINNNKKLEFTMISPSISVPPSFSKNGSSLEVCQGLVGDFAPFLWMPVIPWTHNPSGNVSSLKPWCSKIFWEQTPGWLQYFFDFFGLYKKCAVFRHWTQRLSNWLLYQLDHSPTDSCEILGWLKQLAVRMMTLQIKQRKIYLKKTPIFTKEKKHIRRWRSTISNIQVR